MTDTLRSAALPVYGPTIVLHGGAWDIPDEVLADHRDGMREAMEVGITAVRDGQPALDVATAVVAALESHGAFDAGRGAMLNQDGRAQLDAGVMDGATLNYGSVMAVERCASPVRVARRLLDAGNGSVRMLTGVGAERFAEAEGFDLIDNGELVCDREQKRFDELQAQAQSVHPSEAFLPGAPSVDGDAASPGHDTVGCVVRDTRGQFAAATSTGGTPFKPPGRIGDSPLPGAGFYANERGAVSSTGWGEAIAAVVLAHSILRDVEEGSAAEEAARRELSRMHRRIQNPDGSGACGGVIILTGKHAVWAHTTPRMARAIWRGGEPIWLNV
jgi:L-asparaginase / beta-aspartyl-peptidase